MKSQLELSHPEWDAPQHSSTKTSQAYRKHESALLHHQGSSVDSKTVQLPLLIPLSGLSDAPQIQVEPKLRSGPAPDGQGIKDRDMGWDQSRPLWF